MTLKFIKKLESVKNWTICVPSFKHFSKLWAPSFTIELLPVFFSLPSLINHECDLRRVLKNWCCNSIVTPNSGRQTWHISGRANKSNFVFTFSFLQHGNSKAIFRPGLFEAMSLSITRSAQKFFQKAASLGKNTLSRHTIFFWENCHLNSFKDFDIFRAVGSFPIYLPWHPNFAKGISPRCQKTLESQQGDVARGDAPILQTSEDTFPEWGHVSFKKTMSHLTNPPLGIWQSSIAICRHWAGTPDSIDIQILIIEKGKRCEFGVSLKWITSS